ncbi:MAG: vsrB [Bradyrhizobium sp.]|nr:vsrB [Bradyrhizobium sp.]
MTIAAAPLAAPGVVYDDVERECLLTVARSGSRVHPGAYMAVGFVVAVGLLWSPWPVVAIWLASMLTLNTLLIMFARRLLRSIDDPAIATWQRRDLSAQLAQGVGWGASALLMIPDGNVTALAAICCCLCAIVYDSAARSASSPLRYVTWLGAILATLALYFARHADITHLLIGIGALFVFLGAVLTNRDLARRQRMSIRVRFDNEIMLREVQIERALAEESRVRAEQANLAKSQFLAAASHDLRQPLYALGLFAASLDTLRLDAQARSVVAGINDSVRVMETLFDTLLDLSKLEAGVVVPDLGTVALEAVFDELSQIFRPIALERGLDLRFTADGKAVASDAALLKQVLANMIANALRATIRGGVLVGARRRSDQVRLEIWDTGTGIAPDQLDTIFGEFVQLGNPERDRRKGLGLGLAIARRAARLLGSEIEVSSRLGRGSRFSITQPAAEAGPGLASPPEEPVPASLRRAGCSVLVVEDEADVRLALSDLLDRWQVPNLAVGRADAAVEAASATRFGLVLADFRLGDTDGLALVRQLRALDPELPAALITADFNPLLLARAQAAGVLLFHKPLRPELLRQLVGEAVEAE